MSESFYLKAGDTSPALRATLQNPDGTAVDLTGATVVFNMRSSGNTVLISRVACSIVTAASGIVQYDWQAGDTDTVGQHLGEFEVTFADSTVETFPNDGYIRVIIARQIA